MSRMLFIARLIATSGGSGYLPKAPGTFGALAGLLVSICIGWFCVDNVIMVHYLHITLIVAFYIAGVWATKMLIPKWGTDPSRIVIDETVGFWISILFIPVNWSYYVAAFILFRFFDIVKPLGIKKIDRLHTAQSVMLDDVVAGVYANVLLQLLIRIYE